MWTVGALHPPILSIQIHGVRRGRAERSFVPCWSQFGGERYAPQAIEAARCPCDGGPLFFSYMIIGMKLALLDRHEVADGTTAFWFEAPTTLSFTAGQWVDITLANQKYRDDGGTTRTFSIANSPHHKNKLMVVMRNGKSAFKRSLRELAIGAKVKLTGIGGSFVLSEKPDKEVVMLAGGIGVAPMRSMVEWAMHEKLEHKITLLYSNRTAGEAAFLDELHAWEKENQSFKLVATVTEGYDPSWKGERGRIDEAMLRRHVPDISSARYYIAGPPAMVAATWQMLVGMGVDDGAIKTEEFSGY